MTTTQNDIVINLKAIDSASAVLRAIKGSFDEIEGSIQHFNQTMSKLNFIKKLQTAGLTLNEMGRVTDVTTGRFVDMESAVSRVAKATTAATKLTQRFKMEWLSIMFAAMAVERAGKAALRSIFDTFQKAEGNTSALTHATVQISAAWEFLKFSIFNALDQPIFIQVISFLVDMVNWVSDLVNRFPGLGVTMLGVFGALAVGGSIFMIVSQFVLTWDAIFGVGGVLGKKMADGFGTIAAEKGTVAGAMSGGIFTLKNIIGAGLLIGVGLDILNRGRDYKWNSLDFAKDLFGAALGGAMIAGLPGAAAGVLGALILFLAVKLDEAAKQRAQQEIAELLASGMSARHVAGIRGQGPIGMETISGAPLLSKDLAADIAYFQNNPTANQTPGVSSGQFGLYGGAMPVVVVGSDSTYASSNFQ